MMATLIFGFLFIPNFAYAGLGISPGTVIFDNVRPGSEIVKQIYFSRADASREQVLSIKLEGSAADALSGPSELILPIGKNSVAYPLVINTGTLPTGIYEASLRGMETVIKGSSGQEGENGDQSSANAVVSLGVRASIRFTVTNDVVQEFSIKEVIMQASEEGQVLGFSYFLVNSGNVDARPSKINIVITDQTDSTNVYYETIDGNNLKPVKAFSERDELVQTNAQLRVGRYWVDMTFYDGDLIIFERKQLPLQIFPPGTLAQKGELMKFNIDKQEYEQNELMIFDGVFTNQGQVGIMAEFLVDIVRIQGEGNKRVDLLKTEPVFIPPQKSANFSLNKRLEEGGNYIANGFVNFGIYHSNELQVEFTVKQLNIIVVVVTLLVISIILALLVWLIARRRVLKTNVSVVDSTPIYNNQIPAIVQDTRSEGVEQSPDQLS